MNPWIKKIGLLLFILFLMGQCPPLARADELTDAPLKNIKERLGEEQIEVVDFSKKLWGNLSPAIREKIQNPGGFQSLTELEEYFSENDTDDAEKIETLQGWGLTNREANQVVNELRFKGESQVNAVLFAVINVVRNLVLWLAILFIMICGLRLIFAQGEETVITEQKKGILYAVVGLVGILLVEQIIYAIYGAPGTVLSLQDRGPEFSEEILGVVAYVKTLVAILGTVMVILSGAQMMFAFGEEEKIKNQRKAVVWIGIGIILILINQVVVENIFILPIQNESQITTENVGSIIALFANVTKFVLGFVGLIALAALLYGAGLFITNYANEEQVEKAKKIIKNALLGIMIILTAFALIATLIDFP